MNPPTCAHDDFEDDCLGCHAAALDAERAAVDFFKAIVTVTLTALRHSHHRTHDYSPEACDGCKGIRAALEIP